VPSRDTLTMTKSVFVLPILKKRATVVVTLAAAILTDTQGRCILLPPPKGARKATADDIPTLVSGMWHFPTIAAGKNPQRELRTYLSENFIGAKSPKSPAQK